MSKIFNQGAAKMTESWSDISIEGDGDTKRTGKIVADVSCVVTQVSSNGNLAIHGSQSTLINHENSILTVDGTVRRTDISLENVVTSDRIANSRIEITGRGVISDKQKPGFYIRAFDWIWPF
jgi:flagellar L-ring protein precursor FlgH